MGQQITLALAVWDGVTGVSRNGNVFVGVMVSIFCNVKHLNIIYNTSITSVNIKEYTSAQPYKDTESKELSVSWRQRVCGNYAAN